MKKSAAMITFSSVDTQVGSGRHVDESAHKNSHEVLVCGTCGTHYPRGSKPEVCDICNDDRQYIPDGGQVWTSYMQLLRNNSVRILQLGDSVYELQIKPTFGIGQRALLILSNQGNVLWDCIPMLSEPTIDFIKAKGGLKAVAFSHPHYYSNMNDWAEAFNCPIYIHRNDEQWIMNRGRHIDLWDGPEKSLWDGIRIINLGGHFPGSSILHVPSISKEGAIFCGDTLTLAPSRRHVAVMFSYPNRIPLPVKEMERIKKRLDAIPFDTFYGFYSDQNLTKDVKEIVEQSFARYV